MVFNRWQKWSAMEAQGTCPVCKTPVVIGGVEMIVGKCTFIRTKKKVGAHATLAGNRIGFPRPMHKSCWDNLLLQCGVPDKEEI